MGVLAIAQHVAAAEVDGAKLRLVGVLRMSSQPRGDRGVVSAGLLEGSGGKLQTQGFLHGRRAAQGLQDPLVLPGPADDAHVAGVLRRGPQQAGTADVDHLDRLLKRAVRPGHRVLERVQVHDHQVDRPDPLLGKLPHVLRVVPVGQNGRMDPRMQRLDPPVQHLREAGDILHQSDGDARVRQVPGRPAGREDLEPEFLVQGPGKIDQAGLVVNADQGSSGVGLTHERSVILASGRRVGRSGRR